MSQSRASTVISRERVGPLIGQSGAVKARIERAFKVDVTVDSHTGVVEITPSNSGSDPSALLKARDVVVAIGRGFAPDRAFRLFSEDCVLEVIDLEEALGKSDRDIARVKGRIIGSEGKTRRLIEEMSGALISVYGATVSIIGNYEAAFTAREAVGMLVKGKQHSTMYRFLRRRRGEEKKRERLELWEKPGGQ